MAVRRVFARACVAAAGVLWPLAAMAPDAEAHPLGNFSINHYFGFTVRQDRISVLAVTDTAEIPTLQEQQRVDRDGDGTVDDAERTVWAAAGCAQTATQVDVTVGTETATDTATRRLVWTVRSSSFRYAPGAAGLRTSRLECVLDAPLRTADGPAGIRVETGVDPTRVGWNEVTARGDGVRLTRSDVPSSSVSQELRAYPRDLLASPRGVTRAAFTVEPGTGTDSAAGAVTGLSAGGPTAWIAALSGRVSGLAAVRQLTVPVGVLAVVLSAVLGAGHALLPGHGKAAMAAYLAGRRGSTRDAVTVGTTVTVTHTAGVLVMGLCLTAFSSLAGDLVLGWLGVLSGGLVAVIGASLTADAVRRARAGRGKAVGTGEATPWAEPELTPVPSGPGPAAHHHDHGHSHDHGPAHHHGHHHDHGPAHHHDHGVQEPDVHTHDRHTHGLFGHRHHDAAERPLGTRGLIGLGIAGGLVPSPSALVVLLGAVALGRTLFGAALVLAYGLGMAATLTTVGLLFVRLGDRLAGTASGRVVRGMRRVAPYTALLTALLVLTVGVGLMVRSLPSTL